MRTPRIIPHYIIINIASLNIKHAYYSDVMWRAEKTMINYAVKPPPPSARVPESTAYTKYQLACLYNIHCTVILLLLLLLTSCPTSAHGVLTVSRADEIVRKNNVTRQEDRRRGQLKKKKTNLDLFLSVIDQFHLSDSH